MPGFQAEGVVEALDWDFNPYVAAKGTIPEPTDAQIAAFLAGIKAVVKEVQSDLPADLDPSDPVALFAAMDSLDPAKTVEQMSAMCAVYSAACSGTPTAEQIAALPMRVRTIFFAWFQGEVMSPEAVSPGGNGQVTKLPVGRAG
jgi:hypothetical protein